MKTVLYVFLLAGVACLCGATATSRVTSYRRHAAISKGNDVEIITENVSVNAIEEEQFSAPTTISAYFSNPTDFDQDISAFDLLPYRARILNVEVVLVEDTKGKSKAELDFLHRVEKGKNPAISKKYSRGRQRADSAPPTPSDPLQESGVVVRAAPHSVYEYIVTFTNDISEAEAAGELKDLYSTMMSFDVIGEEGYAIEGFIKSPDYGLTTYPDDSDFKWRIHIPLRHLYTLDITLTELDIESCCDKLMFYAGTSELDPILGIFSGLLEDVDQPTLHSYSENVFVRFHSDCALNTGSFSFVYSTSVAEELSACTGDTEIHARSGTLTSRGYYLDYPENSDCSWTLVTDDASRITLYVDSFDFQDGDIVSVSDVYEYETSSIKDISNADVGTAIVGGWTNKMQVTMVTGLHDKQYGGFSLRYSSTPLEQPCDGGVVAFGGEYGIIKSPNYPESYGNDRVCTWQISAEAGTSIYLNILDFDTEEFYDRLYIYDGPEAIPTNQIAGLSGEQTGDAVYVTKTDQTYIQFLTDYSIDNHRGFQIEVKQLSKTSECIETGSDVEGKQGYLSTPNYPNSFPGFSDCQYLIQVGTGMVMDLLITDVDISYEQDTLVVYDGSSQSDRIMFTAEPVSNDLYLTSTTETVLVVFQSGVNLADRRGFLMRFNEVDVFAEYSGVISFTSPQGEIESPSYPQYYPSDIQGNWLIQVPIDNTIGLLVKRFTVGADDTLIAYDGDSTTSNELFTCQGSTCKPVQTTGNAMFIYFDGKTSSPGFSFNYYAVGKSCATSSHEVSSTEGYITSPNFPYLYPSGLNCDTNLLVPEFSAMDEPLVIRFDIHGLNSESCCDFLTIYDGPTTSDPVIFRGSGTMPDFSIYSTSNEALVRWTVDAADSLNGFSLYYEAVPTKQSEGSGSAGDECELSNTLTSYVGEVFSPGYPNIYPNYVDNCWFFLYPAEVVAINFFFPSFSTEEQHDTVKFFRGFTTEEYNLVQTMSGDYDDYSMNILAGEVTVLFHTDGSLGKSGFLFKYEAVTTIAGGIPYL